MRALAACIAAVLLTAGWGGALHGDLIVWTGAESDDSWFSANNWNLGRIPGAGDDVEIDVAKDPTVAFDDAAGAIIQSISCTEAIDLSDGELRFGARSALHGSLTLSGGTLSAGGPLNLMGDSLWQSGTINAEALFTILGDVDWQGVKLVADDVVIVASDEFKWESGDLTGPEGILNVSDRFLIVGDVNHLVAGSMLENLGTITHSGGGDLQLANSTLLNRGFYELAGSGTLRRGDTYAIIDNFGTIRKSGDGVTRITPDFNNLGGTLEVLSGVLEIVGRGVSTGGKFLVSLDATLDLSTIEGKLKEFSGAYSNDNTDGTILLASGELRASGVTFDINGAEGFVWTGGRISASALGLTNVGDAFAIADRFAEKQLVGTLLNEGTITHTNAALDLSGTIHNMGTYSLVGESEISGGGFSEFANRGGLFHKSGAESALVDVNFTNSGSGTLQIDAGTLALNQGFTQNSDNASIVLGPGDAVLSVPRNLEIDAGVLEGTGVIDAAQVRNSANFIVGGAGTIGRIDMDGVYVQSAAGTLSIDIGGKEAGEFDQLTAVAALLDGKLVITLLNGYEPEANAEFEIIVASSASGAFSSIEPECWTAEKRGGMVVLSVGTPGINKQPADQRVCRDGSAQFCVETSGGLTTYQWLKDGKEMGGETQSCLTIDPVSVDDAGKYSVVVTNSCGLKTESDEADLTVDVDPTIETDPTDQEVKVGEDAQFDVTIDTAATLPLTYDWQKKNDQDEWVTVEKHVDLDVFADALEIENAQMEDDGEYRVVVSNVCGDVTSSVATLEVEVDVCEPCDTNCDGSVDLTDVEPFIELLLGGSPCAECAGDTNNDGSVDLGDVEGFISCLIS